MSTDKHDKGGQVDGDAIKGDVIADAIRRVTGERGSADGLIEIPLVGHRHRYRVRVDTGGPAPRLVELHLISDGDAAEIDPDSIRQVPVRRLAKAAARFIALTEFGVAEAGDVYDPTPLLRPDLEPPGRSNRKLDDVHYRQVRDLLLWAREVGESPREYVAERFAPVSLPTVDRWIAEAKRRGFLRRDWLTNPSPAD
ncbi:hypothetical protein [Mycobacterium sp. SMC-14]|uniref:hypothetical protein n=1 Tax=Mycobacterium sp. SMC-14 TaxID=3385968 RepID=UPI00390CA017